MGLAKELTDPQKGGIIVIKKLGHNEDAIAQQFGGFLQPTNQEQLRRND